MVNKFFKEFSGNKTAFKNGGYETTLANNIVFIMDEANNGAGACIFARGMYFGNFAELVAALAFVKGINVGGKNYSAANGGGYVKFEAADPATVVYIENNGVKIGLSAAFVEAHDAVISDVAAIKADYLKNADKEALQQSINDKDAAMKQYVDAEIAKVATSEAFNALTGRVSTLEGEIVTERGRIDVLAPKVETLIGSDADMSARAIVQDEVAKQLQSENISESFDTLKEMAEYLSSHPEDVTKMNASIKQNADDIDAIEKELETLATSESLGALEVRVKANEDAVATVDTRISTAVSAAEGRVDTKLADYAKTADVNEELGKKADQSAMETALGNKADKSYVDTELGKKADASTTYSKTEVDGLVAPKANAADVYTKTEVDNMFAWERIEA